MKVEESFTNAATIRGWIEERASRTVEVTVAMLASLPLPARAVTAEPPTSTPVSPHRLASSLRIFVAPTIADAALIPAWLEEHNRDIDQALALPGHEQWVAVQVDGITYDYHVTVTAMRDGEPLVSASESITCECNSEHLLALLDREISSAVYRLRATPVAPPVVKPTLTASTPTSEHRPKVVEPYPPRLSVSRLGVAGAATGAFGLIVLGAGTTFAVIEPREIDGWSKLERDFAPLGYAMICVGTAIVAGGVAMIVVDAIRLRGRSKHGKTKTRRPLALTPKPSFFVSR